MSGRHSRSTPGGGQGGPPAEAEAEADATATTIAGLRWRLMQHPQTLHYAKVRRELRQLEELITAHLDHAGPSPGRHRCATGLPSSQQIGDADGFDLKPDPLTATTPAQFNTALRHYRAWSGNPPWRKMAENAGQACVHSTMYAAVNAGTLPKLEVVKAIITGCGGSDDDLRAYATAWRRITTGHTGTPPPNGHILPAPLPAPRLIAAGEP